MKNSKSALILLGCMVFVLLTGCAASKQDMIAKAKMKDAQAFMDSCETIEYDRLLRASGTYINQPIKVDVRIEQDMGYSSYRAYSGFAGDAPKLWSEDEYILVDYRDEAQVLALGDAVAVYGLYYGQLEVQREMGGNIVNLPAIAVIHVQEEPECVRPIREMMDRVVFVQTQSARGDVMYEAHVKNTTDWDFFLFSLDVRCLNLQGEEIGKHTMYAVDWTSGSETVFTFFSPPKECVQIEITQWDYET